jgi:hypothetical protein
MQLHLLFIGVCVCISLTLRVHITLSIASVARIVNLLLSLLRRCATGLERIHLASDGIYNAIS